MNRSPNTLAAPKPGASSGRTLPGSLLRLRRFLFRYGMPIVPWATAEEVLDEFYELLCSNRTDDAFWSALGEQLEALNIEIAERLGANQRVERLQLADRQALVAEIRRCLDVRPPARSGFAALATRLSQRCLVALLVLGGATTVSCGARVEDSRAQSAVGGGATGGAPGNAGTTGQGGATFRISSPSMGGAGVCVTSVSAAPGLSMDDVRGIAVRCVESGPVRDSVLACLDTLDTDWQRGLEYVLNCVSCDTAAGYLRAVAQACPGDTDAFDCLRIGACLALYDGVRLA